MSEKPWQEQGYEETKLLGDGRAAGLMRLAFGGRICVGSPDNEIGYEEAYDYEFLAIAAGAFFGWDGEGEPEEWVRHIPSYRRRPDGDASREYVAP